MFPTLIKSFQQKAVFFCLNVTLALERIHFLSTKTAPEAVSMKHTFPCILPKRVSKSVCQLSEPPVLWLSFFSLYYKWFVQVRKQNRTKTYELKEKQASSSLVTENNCRLCGCLLGNLPSPCPSDCTISGNSFDPRPHVFVLQGNLLKLDKIGCKRKSAALPRAGIHYSKVCLKFEAKLGKKSTTSLLIVRLRFQSWGYWCKLLITALLQGCCTSTSRNSWGSSFVHGIRAWLALSSSLPSVAAASWDTLPACLGLALKHYSAETHFQRKNEKPTMHSPTALSQPSAWQEITASQHLQ